MAMAACQGICQPSRLSMNGNAGRIPISREGSSLESVLTPSEAGAVVPIRLAWRRRCLLRAASHKVPAWKQLRKASTAARALKENDLHLVGSQQLVDGSTLFTFSAEEPKQVEVTAGAANPSARADNSLQSSSLPPRLPSSFKKQSPILQARSLRASADTSPSTEDEPPNIVRPALPPRLPSNFRKRSPIHARQKQAQEDSSEAGTLHFPNFSFKSIHPASTGGNGIGLASVNYEVLDQVSFPSSDPAAMARLPPELNAQNSLGQGPSASARGLEDSHATPSAAARVSGSTSSLDVDEAGRGRRKKASAITSSSSDDDDGGGSLPGGDASKGKRGRRKKSEPVSSPTLVVPPPHVHPLPSRLTTTSFIRRNPIPSGSHPRAAPGAVVVDVNERRRGRPRSGLKEEEQSGTPVGSDGDDGKVQAQDIKELYDGTITLGKLKALAKAFGMKGYTKLRKPELIEVLQGVVPRPDV